MLQNVFLPNLRFIDYVAILNWKAFFGGRNVKRVMRLFWHSSGHIDQQVLDRHRSAVFSHFSAIFVFLLKANLFLETNRATKNKASYRVIDVWNIMKLVKRRLSDPCELRMRSWTQNVRVDHCSALIRDLIAVEIHVLRLIARRNNRDELRAKMRI